MQSNIIPKTDSVKDILDPFKIDSWKAVLVLISGGRSLSSGYNNENITGWVANKQQKFLIVLEARTSKIKVPANTVFGRDQLSGSWTTYLFTVSSFGQRGKGVPWGLVNKGTNPIHESPPHDLIAGPPPNTITWGVGF